MKLSWNDFQKFSEENLTGKLCWGAGRAHGSLISFEMGNPILKIIPSPKESSDKYDRVHVVGDFTIIIMYCDWVIYKCNKSIMVTSNDDQDSIDKAIIKMEGQNYKYISKTENGFIINFESGICIKMTEDNFYDVDDEIFHISCRDLNKSFVFYRDRIAIED